MRGWRCLRGGGGEKDGLQTYLRPLLWAPWALRAMMESAHGEPIDETGLKGQACCRLSPSRSDLFRHHSASLRSVRGWAELGLSRLSGGLRFWGGLEVAVVLPDGPGDASELVGEGDGGLVVAELALEAQRPRAESVAVLHALGVPQD